jgi:hypothetical protein
MRISGGGAQYFAPLEPTVQVVLPVQSVACTHALRQIEVCAVGPAHTVGGSQ